MTASLYETRLMTKQKQCATCQEVKPVAAFSWANKKRRYWDSRCKACRRDAQRRRQLFGTCDSRAEAAGLDVSEFAGLSDADAGFIAGILEGEGSIHSSYPVSGAQPLVIKVSMVLKPTIEKLARLTKTTVFKTYMKRDDGHRRRTQWTWQIYGMRAGLLLQRCLPMLEGKREEAQAAIEIVADGWLTKGPTKEAARQTKTRAGKVLRELKQREWQ